MCISKVHIFNMVFGVVSTYLFSVLSIYYIVYLLFYFISVYILSIYILFLYLFPSCYFSILLF